MDIFRNKKAKEHRQKNQVLETIQLEFEPPEIETCQFTKEELAEMEAESKEAADVDKVEVIGKEKEEKTEE